MPFPCNDFDVDIRKIICVYNVYKESSWYFNNKKQPDFSDMISYRLMYVQEGSYWHQFRQQERIPLRAGSLILGHVTKEPFLNTSCELPFRYTTIHFATAREMDISFGEENHFAVTPSDPAGTEAKFAAALKLCREKPFGYHLRVRSIALDILLSFLQQYAQGKYPCSVPPLIGKSTAIIHRELLSPFLSVKDVAQQCGVTPSYLIRTFTRHYGMTPKKYVDELRVQRASELLRYTDQSMDEIAEQSGFSEARQMRRIFKEHTGVTPQEHRRGT